MIRRRVPCRDYHTAVPCLWAVQWKDSELLEVSAVTPAFAEDKLARKTPEDALAR